MDQADAKLLALFAQRVDLELWQPPSLATRELHALVERLQALQDMRQQESNRLEALSQGVPQIKPSMVIAMVKDHVNWLTAQITSIESEIHDHIDSNPDLKHDADLIRSIPEAFLAADQSWQRNSWPTSATCGDSRAPRH